MLSKELQEESPIIVILKDHLLTNSTLHDVVYLRFAFFSWPARHASPLPLLKAMDDSKCGTQN